MSIIYMYLKFSNIFSLGKLREQPLFMEGQRKYFGKY